MAWVEDKGRVTVTARDVLPGGNTRTTLFVPPHPPYAASGSGCVVTDTDGRQVTDCNNNFTSLIHGHAYPAVVEAASEQLANGSAFGLPTCLEVELAQHLKERMPAAERWRFANSGTEAVMMALRLARAVTGRPLILRFAGSYHGTYDHVVDKGKVGVTPAADTETVVVPVNDAGAFEQAMRCHGEQLACVLLDLMPNRAGLQPVSPEFVAAVRDYTRAAGALLVVDEVITFRQEVGGMQQRYGLAPDVTVLGKVIGGGFPVGAVGGRAEFMDWFDPRHDGSIGWGGTFSANPVTMAAGLAALDAYDEPRVRRLNGLGDHLRECLAAAGYDVTGSGSLLRVFSDNPGNLWWRLYRAGVLICPNGLMSLSTPMTDDVIDHIIEAFKEVRP